MSESPTFHGTTILSVRRGGRVAMGGDGQVTLGNVVVKASARKVRRMYQDKILSGFAGGTADAFTLFERFEAKLEKRVPQPFRRHAHHWLILHGRYICKARLPECWRCPVVDLCRYNPKVLAPPAGRSKRAA